MTPYHQDDAITLYHGDALTVLRELPAQSVNACITSPPYFGLRDYGEAGQYGLEASPAEYVETMRALFAEVRRVLADDGTLWLNLGDSYSGGGGGGGGKAGAYIDGGTPRRNGAAHYERMGVPPKNLLGIPWRTAFALQDDGWILRNDIIWAKPNAMPESVTDRLSTRHEHLFMFAKSRTYWFDLDPIREAYSEDASRRRSLYGLTMSDKRYAPADRKDAERQTSMGVGGQSENPLGRNPGDVWTIPTQPFTAAHFAVMPQALAERAILAGCRPGGTVLDPFSGSGTTGLAANKHGRKYIGIDLSATYLDLSLRTRFAQPGLDFGEASA